MIIKNYNELKNYFNNSYDENQENIIDSEKMDGYEMDFDLSNSVEWILKFDEEGNYTSYPNEKLKENKFRITKKHCNLEIPEHRHEYMEIVYLMEGKIEMTVDGESITMKKNDICIMNNNVKHSNKALSSDDLAINILLTDKVFDSVFMHLLSDDNYISNFIINSFYSSNKTKKYMIKNIEENSFLESVLINLICEYYSNSIRCKSKINGCLLLLFTELSRMFNEPKEININKKCSKIKNNIVEYLQKEYKETSLLKAAEHFNFHPNYLSNLVKKEFGKNFKDLLIDIRMVEAGRMLRTTDKKINIIMEDVGYFNESYFYRQFRNKYNTTPFEYRKQNLIKS
ncbi:HTH-type transcriptional activator RhaS [bioreactor metagenome]|uniref:HTH-type transcriptional activator RhaS n=1 Tax=bioreactor metagenome TaxID=1076179 RepID=A0A645BI73_9ZZZZ